MPVSMGYPRARPGSPGSGLQRLFARVLLAVAAFMLADALT
ncbi:hypothetical protein OHR86_25870 [Streptomyces sp. NBC_00441]|nr:hypothetical protein [Streptomyces sp. NBC_00441]